MWSMVPARANRGFAEARRRMVDHQLRPRGIGDPRVLAAMDAVPRERFVAPALAPLAYEDRPLPIDNNQTISQPYVVALMVEALRLAPTDRALEVGTGSGYAAAVMSELAAEVYTIERHQDLANSARSRLAELGYDNVHVRWGDGSLGLPEHAPYDAIAVAAAAPEPPSPLIAQLAVGGRLVMPIGSPDFQLLYRITRMAGDDADVEVLKPVTFVPLIGSEGWKE